ncbi:stalk domain-containing protein [Paenibacillus sp. FSL K6-2524]|uniref:stalk domain-containing protein n=1 Tax=Paenibacillus sp. FSL K6-2524 TaxID=2954516 RepID=UPI0030FA5DFE
MKKLLTKKVLVVTTVASLILGISSATYAASTLKKITAYENAAIKVEVDGKSVNFSSDEGMMYPIVYNGHSYVSAKAVAEALGATVEWDGARQAVVITSSGEVAPELGIPNKDNTTKPTPSATPTPTAAPTATETAKATAAPATSSSATTNNKGTMTDPIKLGTAFTYTDYYNYNPSENHSTTAQYTLAVKKVTPITRDEIVKLGYTRPANDDKIDYVMVDLDLKVKNATFKKGASSLVALYLAQYTPEIWGVKTASGGSIIGGTDFGFDGSLSDNIDLVLSDFPKVADGESKSFEASGKVLLPIVKGAENLLAIKRQDTSLDYDASFIYFKLK